jgi:serine protease AprX
MDKDLTGKGVKLAIIDTGIDLSHPEFKHRTLKWADLVNFRDKPYDDNGHGTHIAGLIAAEGNWETLFSNFYLRGIAPGVELIIIKAIAADGKGDESNVAQGIDTAVANGADVVILSLGGGTLPILGTQTEASVNRAINSGVYIVAAAGNAQQDGQGCTVTSPASVARVIAVGAVDKSAKIADFSCRGGDNDTTLLPPNPGRSDPNKKPEVVAPGVEILSAWKDGKYVQASGTSQAAPYVGGILALLLEKHPEMKRTGDDRSVQRMKEILMTSSKKVGSLAGRGATAHDDSYGYGLVQAEAALKALG